MICGRPTLGIQAGTLPPFKTWLAAMVFLEWPPVAANAYPEVFSRLGNQWGSINLRH